MYFSKFPHPANFTFATSLKPSGEQIEIGGKEFGLSITSHEGDIYRIAVTSELLWSENQCLVSLNTPPEGGKDRVKAHGAFHLAVYGKGNHKLASAPSIGSFGVSGKAHLFAFQFPEEARFYGMGEKCFGEVELSAKRSKFYNTDVWGDFHLAQVEEHPIDPSYFSTPYVVAKVGSEYVGFLLDNPYPSFIQTPGVDDGNPAVEPRHYDRNLYIGSDDGQPVLWVIYGPSLADVTRKLQTLVGKVPTPPIWSLGYQQSKWGYMGHDDIVRVDEKLAENQIPCDGIWMDLEHMDGYRIFTVGPTAFPEGPQTTAAIVGRNQRRIVPILDPGVKFEKGFSVYEDGSAKKVFCQNREGSEYVGIVWPGRTVFPDFSKQTTRDWWSDYVVGFRELGYGSTWVDMNDPSTGSVDPSGMLFQDGKEVHGAYHNQYALGMQMATHQGFLKYAPNERPFMLTRSGFTGSSRFAAVWTGDNVSNRFHLKLSIPTAIGMSISGMPFCGPDLGGFGGDCSEELMIDWVKTDFLFPVFRNHSHKDSTPQEPFAYSQKGMKTIRRFIRLRYKLMPYLYNLFINQEEQGDPILRPLFYEFNEDGLDTITDQFMIGASILQAPFVEGKGKTREVRLPGLEAWYDAQDGKWVEPGIIEVKKSKDSTPLYIRAGSLLPTQAGTPVDNTKELNKVHIHVFVPPAWNGEQTLVYRADDGISFDYQTGARSELEVCMTVAEGDVVIASNQVSDGFGAIEPKFVFHGTPKSIRINGAVPELKTGHVVLAGDRLKVSIAQ